ncbi:flavin reductase family protein [Dyadobacter luteus]|uniref:Flavin reductase family protein n=1 Tax=Dyadobacter luteus TaxID=2259619 RepID=A0A3D8Y8N3_9BACT|nr:flavin reductase [Dyadobacter luteus]REA59686.1 flavin reductase family protein [Dyadobacter luteus]
MYHVNYHQILEMEKFFRINLINSIVGFKSLNLLGTISENGESNLCPVSSAFHLGANPPLIGIVMRPERAHNDTLKNIKSTGFYTLNNVLPDWYKAAHQASASYPSGVSEFAACGFKEQYLDEFRAPFVSESTVKIGLEVEELMDVKLNGTTIVIGRVSQIITEDTLLEDDGTINHTKAKTMTVAGLDAYFLPQFLERLPYAKP